MREELKPCPFCGDEGDLNQWFEVQSTASIICVGCSAQSGIYDTETEAAAAWNARAPANEIEITSAMMEAGLSVFYDRSIDGDVGVCRDAHCDLVAEIFLAMAARRRRGAGVDRSQLSRLPRRANQRGAIGENDWRS
jgi:Lar family restriction alleviation protein